MHEEVSVLLLSVGESPTELKAELERLGVSVIESEFLDAEEKIEEATPDLVVLGGSRGAMELATLLDDQEGEHRPRMVIVAARKDLAKLRGLNREVVISLFALETTEKVVGQRVESLARRAARRRAQAGSPPVPAAKATSLGLPSAHAIVGQLNLKKVQAPSPPGIKVEKPEPVPSEAKVPNERPEPPRRGQPKVQKKEEDESSPEQPAAKEVVIEDGLVPDEDLLSLPPSQPPEGDVELEEIPATPGLPSIEAAADSSDDPSGGPTSMPPTLPPEAKEKSSPQNPIQKKEKEQSSDELDISDAEHALENLDSSKAEITASLLKDAQDYLSDAKGPAISEAGSDSDEPSEHERLTVPAAPQDDGVSGVEAAIDSLGATVALSPPLNHEETHEENESSSASDATGNQEATETKEPTVDPEPDEEAEAKETAELGGDELGGEPKPEASDDEQEASPETPAVATDDDSREEKSAVDRPVAALEPSIVPESLEPSIAPESHASVSRNGNKGPWGLLLVAVAALGLGAAYSTGVIGSSKEPPTEEFKASAGAEDKGHAVSATNSEASDEHPGEPLQPEGRVAGEGEPAGLAEEPPATDSKDTESSATLADPFLIADADLPGCETLVDASQLGEEKDPVYQASVVWQEAREMIVAGKLKVANLKMCEAVALNPESAAVEGLAALYLRLKSPRQALKWVDRADELRPGQSEMGYVRGDIYSLMGRSQEARTIWLKTLNIPEDDSTRIAAVSRDYSVEAGRHLRRGDLVRADQWFRRAVILDPENIAGIIGLAKTFHKDGDPAHARAFSEMSLEVSDEIPEVHVMLGELALADGDEEGARVRFERALAVRPDFYPAKRGLSQVK